MRKTLRILCALTALVGFSFSGGALRAQQVNYDCVSFPLFPLDSENWLYYCDGVYYNSENVPACEVLYPTLWAGVTDNWPYANCPDDCDGPRIIQHSSYDPLRELRMGSFVGHSEEITATTGSFQLTNPKARKLFSQRPVAAGQSPLVKVRLPKEESYRYFRVFRFVQQQNAPCSSCSEKDRYVALEIAADSVKNPALVPAVSQPQRTLSNKGVQPKVWGGSMNGTPVLMVLKKI